MTPGSWPIAESGPSKAPLVLDDFGDSQLSGQTMSPEDVYSKCDSLKHHCRRHGEI